MLKLAIPDLISNSYFPAIAAVELGCFRDEGLDVEIETIFPVDAAYRALRDGAVDFVGASAHAALSAFPEWDGVKLLCAQAQGMYWFLVMHADYAAARGDLRVLRGRRIGAAPWVDMGLHQILAAAGIDPGTDQITIAPVPRAPGSGPTISFGTSAAQALEERRIDGFWANGMGAEVAVRRGIGTVVLDVRRGDGPAGAFDYTFSALATTEALIARAPDQAAAAVRALTAAQAALAEQPDAASRAAARLFPAYEASLLPDLIRRDVPFYDARITPAAVNGLNQFATRLGIAKTAATTDRMVATRFAPHQASV